MKVGILGCGAIADVITDFALKGKVGVDLACFTTWTRKERKVSHLKLMEQSP